jgi:hypothetical protein
VALKDLTHAAVLAAVAEFDRAGRSEFLRSTGFGPDRSYFLDYGRQLYDSRAIAGYAHGVSTGRQLGPADFSGADRTVARQLEKLGFTVRRTPHADHARQPAEPAAGSLDGEHAGRYCTRCGYPFADPSGHQEVCNWPSACERRLHDPIYRVPPQRLARVETQMRQYLIGQAASTSPEHAIRAKVTYGDLCRAIDPGERYWKAPRFKGVGDALARIGQFEHEHKRPMLTALVVRSGSRRPGRGVIDLCRRLGVPIPADSEVPFWRAQVEDVVRYWSGPDNSEQQPAVGLADLPASQSAPLAEVLEAVFSLRSQKGAEWASEAASATDATLGHRPCQARPRCPGAVASRQRTDRPPY